MVESVRESEFRANLDKWEELALSETVVITDEDGTPQLALISHEVFEKLSRSNLRAYAASELPEEALQSILDAKAPTDDDYESNWPDDDSA